MKAPIGKPVNDTQRTFNTLCEKGGGVKGGPARGKVLELLRETGQSLNGLATSEMISHLAAFPSANPWHVCFAVGLSWGHLARLELPFTEAVCNVLADWNTADLNAAKSFHLERGPTPIEQSLVGAHVLFSKVTLPDTLPDTLEKLGRAQERWLSPILNPKDRPPYIGAWNATAMFMTALFGQPALAATQNSPPPMLPPGGPIFAGLSMLHRTGILRTPPAGSDLDDASFEPGAIYENNGLFAELCKQLPDWSLIDVHSGVYMLGTKHPQTGCRGSERMEFRIADTFTDSLTRLTAQEQKAAKMTAFDLQLDPSSNGLSFHKLDRAKDTNFWSVRVNSDIRLIVHRTASSILLVYVDHHDDAYKWAERRKIERHPTTGAMQLVEVRERVEEVEIFKPKDAPAVSEPAAHPAPRLFDNLRKFELMAFGVPEEWVNDVRSATEETLFDLIEHLPQEAQEALLKLAVGEKIQPPEPAPVEADPFAHPDAQRRFRVLTNAEDLKQALDYPWDKWAVFLHPAQADLVKRSFSGPTRVSGSAGTGKTIVALHRAVHLARANPDATVLLTTFSKALANSLRFKLSSLVGGEPQIASRVVVKAISAVGYDLYSEWFGQPQIAAPALIRSLITKAASEIEGHRFSLHFLVGEWDDVVDAWQLHSWDEYRDVSRLGRKTRIGGKQREILWAIFERVRAGLAERRSVTWSDIFGQLAESLMQKRSAPYDFSVIDEAQDLGVAEARFFGAMGVGQNDGLFFAGDLGQRIFQQPFSWKALGLDVRGRSFTLRINYRTSHQIRLHADRLLPATVSDVDGNTEGRRGTVSMFDGPPPAVVACKDSDHECLVVGEWIMERLKEGCAPNEVGVFVRSETELRRARAAVKVAGIRAVELNDKVEVELGAVAISTMHFAKGLEFRSVVVMACDDDIIPQSDRIESVADDADLEEVYNTERHLLYVACTRARDHLLVTGITPVSEFVDDFLKGS